MAVGMLGSYSVPVEGTLAAQLVCQVLNNAKSTDQLAAKRWNDLFFSLPARHYTGNGPDELPSMGSEQYATPHIASVALSHQDAKATMIIFDEHKEKADYSLSARDGGSRVAWYATGPFNEEDDEEWYADGQASSHEWLTSLAEFYLSGESPNGYSVWSENMSAREGAESFFTAFHREFSDIFLDSFSVIENGESARRYDREIYASPLQRAVLGIARNKINALKETFSPREFEVVVAYALKECGFEKIILRRYCKDDGADILAIISCGKRDELALVEVKHQSRVCGIEVLDRLNGARDRVNADRAILVCSGHISRGAKKSYASKRESVAAYTFQELVALIQDTGDWKQTAHGLWTKGQ